MDQTYDVAIARLAAMVPGAELVRLPGLGHLAHEEAPGQAARIIERAAGVGSAAGTQLMAS